MKNPKQPSPSSSRRRSAGDARANSETQSVGSPPSDLTTGTRILLADDDPGVRGSLSDVLVSEGYVVIPANDGLQALELAASTTVDLVLLDLNMPRKNGWDTFERLSAEHPLLPVIIVTARPNQFFTAVGAGAGALLEKPMEIPTLLRTIRRLLAEPAQQRLARLAGHHTEFHYAEASRRESEKRSDRNTASGGS